MFNRDIIMAIADLRGMTRKVRILDDLASLVTFRGFSRK